MAATKGTRHGNGAGWGGPANPHPDGSRTVYAAGEMLPGQGAGRGHESAAGMDKRARDAARVESFLTVFEEIALDRKQPASARVQAAVAGTNRLLGMPRQSTVVETVERGYIDAPPKAKTMDEWIARLSIPTRNDAGT